MQKPFEREREKRMQLMMDERSTEDMYPKRKTEKGENEGENVNGFKVIIFLWASCRAGY